MTNTTKGNNKQMYWSINRYILGNNKPTKENYVLHHAAASWKNCNDIIYTLLIAIYYTHYMYIYVYIINYS